MFKAVLTNIRLFIDPISSIAELIDEGIFKINKEGISFLAADRAMVAVVDFKIQSSAFEKFDVESDQNIGMNVGNLLSVLRRVSSGDKITFNLLDSKLELILENNSRRIFTIPILDLSQEEVPPIDQLEFTSRVELKPDIIQSGVDDAEVVADSIIIEASSSRFAMRAEGDISKAELELEKGNKSMIELKTDGEVKARYPLDYLKKMMKGAKIADSVSIEWGQDYPMRIGFKSGDKVSLTYILAPRVSEE
jgi:proliferating cell nuclear antigen PCNA